MTRAAIYARQSIFEEQGIVQQLEDCRAEAKRRKFRVVREYVDNDVSGSKERGPQTDWRAMLRDFDEGRFDVLLVSAVDRLTRNLRDVLDVRPPTRDVRIIAIRNGLDTEQDDFMLKQLVLIAEQEVHQKAQRRKRYDQARRIQGHPTTSTPYGYKWMRLHERDDKGTRWEIVPEEAVIVRRLFDEYIGGHSLGSMARRLNEEQVPTKRGGTWHPSTVRDLLLNPAYAGLMAPPHKILDRRKFSIDDCTPGAWPAIIDEDTLRVARRRIDDTQRIPKSTARKWLLAGLAECDICDRPIASSRGTTHPTRAKDGSRAPLKTYHAYRCKNNHFHRAGDIIDEFAKRLVIQRLSMPDAAELLVKETPDVDVVGITKQVEALNAREADIASLIATGKLSAKAAETALAGLSDERDGLLQQLADASSATPLAEAITSEDVEQWWEGASLKNRRAVIEALFTLRIKQVGGGVRVTTLERCAETVDVVWKV